MFEQHIDSRIGIFTGVAGYRHCHIIGYEVALQLRQLVSNSLGDHNGIGAALFGQRDRYSRQLVGTLTGVVNTEADTVEVLHITGAIGNGGDIAQVNSFVLPLADYQLPYFLSCSQITVEPYFCFTVAAHQGANRAADIGRA